MAHIAISDVVSKMDESLKLFLNILTPQLINGIFKAIISYIHY